MNKETIFLIEPHCEGCFACPLCSKSFDTQRKLSYHMRSDSFHKVKYPKLLLDKVRSLSNRGETLSNDYILAHGSWLYCACCKHFNDWANTIRLAGLEYKAVVGKHNKNYWNKRTIIEEIQDRERENKSLYWKDVKREKSALYKYACELFESYGQAIEAAGFDYLNFTKIKPKGYWTKERVLQELRKRFKNAQSLMPKAVEKKCGYLHTIACKLYGSYENAICSLGLNYADIATRHSWTCQEISQKITQLYGKNPSLLRVRAIRINNPKLFAAAFNHFDNWQQAVEVSGFDYQQILDAPAYSQEGEALRSYEEKTVDNILHELNLQHVYEPFLLKHNNGFYKPDWLVEEKLLVEYFGLFGYKKHYANRKNAYDDKTAAKIVYYNSLTDYDFLALYPNDLKDKQSLMTKIANAVEQEPVQI